MKSSEGAGEVEGGWGRLREVGGGWGKLGEVASVRHRDTHTMMNSSRRTCLHVAPHHTSTNTSHVSNPSRSISPLRHVIDEAAVIFSALVLCCLCHRPLCDHGPPRFSTLVAASLSAECHGTVYISSKLALPFGPTLLHFRLLADAVIRGRQTGKWAQREETLPTSRRWQDAWWPLDSKPKPFWAWVRDSVHHRWYLSCVLKSYCNLLIHKWV